MTSLLVGLAIAIALGLGTGRADAAAGHATATAGTSPTLTGRYPLGTQRLCCRARSAGGATATGASHGGSAGSSTIPAPPGPPRSRPTHAPAGGSSLDVGALAALLVLLALAVAGFLVLRRRLSPSGTHPRRRRWVARWLILVLAPLVRYSAGRDAYVLRLVGRRHGPVLVVGPSTPRPHPQARLKAQPPLKAQPRPESAPRPRQRDAVRAARGARRS